MREPLSRQRYLLGWLPPMMASWNPSSCRHDERTASKALPASAFGKPLLPCTPRGRNPGASPPGSLRLPGAGPWCPPSARKEGPPSPSTSPTPFKQLADKPPADTEPPPWPPGAPWPTSQVDSRFGSRGTPGSEGRPASQGSSVSNQCSSPGHSGKEAPEEETATSGAKAPEG